MRVGEKVGLGVVVKRSPFQVDRQEVSFEEQCRNEKIRECAGRDSHTSSVLFGHS